MTDEIDKIELAFEAFHAKTPWVYERLKGMALAAKRAGRESYGIGALFEVLRYEHALATRSDDGLKLNNNHRALYARKIGREVFELQDFFRYRERKARYVAGQVVGPGDAVSAAVNAWDELI
jgi:hypothetical protein